MKTTKIALIAGAAISTGAAAQDLLLVDLTVANEITITATSNAAAASATGSVFTGVLLENFYNSTTGSLANNLVAGDLTTAANASDGSPSIFRGFGNSGLNIWSFSSDIDYDITAGSQAFTGSATWSLSAAEYADALAGSSSGDIYAPADTDDDIAGATLVGQYRVIPAPSAMALLGLGGLVAGRRRR